MLGSFLEFSVGVDAVGDAMEFYRSLGFQDLPTGDFVAAPYAAMWDGNITIGLDEADGLRLRFIRPSLRDYMPVLRRLKVPIAAAELGDDAFNRIAFADPSGHPIELVEARTFSLAGREAASVATCGRFAEISLPTFSLDQSITFWSALGFELISASHAPYPRARLHGSGCTLGLHQTNMLPGTSFVSDNHEQRVEFLRAQQVAVTPVAAPVFDGGRVARLDAPGLPVYLHAAP